MTSQPIGHIVEMALVQVRTLPGDDYETVIRSLQITPSVGAVWYTDLDLGSPVADVDSTRYANDSGENDQTRFAGARPVTMTLTARSDWFPPNGSELWDARWNASSYWVKELSRWAASGFRCALYIRFAGDSNPYRLDLVGRQAASAVTAGQRTYRTVVLSWSCPSGLMREFSEDTDLTRVTKDGRRRYVIAYAGSAAPAASFPVTFPFTFPLGGAGSQTTIPYDGTATTGCIARIHAAGSDLENPAVSIVDEFGNTLQVALRGWSVPQDHYLEINSETKQITLDGDPTQRLEKWLLGPVRWLKLAPGDNFATLSQSKRADTTTPAVPGVGSFAEILFYPAST